jgi:hypothetical protein
MLNIRKTFHLIFELNILIPLYGCLYCTPGFEQSLSLAQWKQKSMAGSEYFNVSRNIVAIAMVLIVILSVLPKRMLHTAVKEICRNHWWTFKCKVTVSVTQNPDFDNCYNVQTEQLILYCSHCHTKEEKGKHFCLSTLDLKKWETE